MSAFRMVHNQFVFSYNLYIYLFIVIELRLYEAKARANQAAIKSKREQLKKNDDERNAFVLKCVLKRHELLTIDKEVDF